MIKVLYEDNHLLIVDKPSGIVTQPTLEHEESLEGVAKAYIKEKYNKPSEVFLHAVHRLDKHVSGIVIFARTSKALSRMNELIRKKQILKIYHAFIHGHLDEKESKLVNKLKKHHQKCRVEEEEGEDGKESSLTYKVLSEQEDTSLVEIILESGRFHQIRAQFSHLGHPVVGDTKYGSLILHKEGHIKLRHVQIEFIHPIKNIPIKIFAQD